MTIRRTRERVTTREDDVQPVETTPVEAEEQYSVTTDPYEERRDSAWRAGQLVYLVFAVVEALIAIRFVMLLLGANPDAGFTSFVYGVTGPLVAPFEGIFGAPDVETGVFDPASLVALIVYPLVGWVIAKLIDILLGERRSAVRTRTHSVDTHVR